MAGSIEIGAPGAGFGGSQPTIIFEPCSGPQTAKLRLHFDVSPTDRDQPAEIGQRGNEEWHALAGPEGNEFCLLRARLDS